ncbi:hypothetical protein DPMN_126850 [Dreissena polymorpha]|uniref:Uncharacterized protein n=1 Tax=Dreissena polymorpha TaxID=45954 RepID=A0A9D4JYJ6_DREPO|nr:hypothetical protein DPMN_126850 [Dreissena polymorpha]
MKNKTNLKISAQYKNVYIEHDLPVEDRIAIANLKTLVKVIGSDKVFVKGNRLVQKSDACSTQSRIEWQEVNHSLRLRPQPMSARLERQENRHPTTTGGHRTNEDYTHNRDPQPSRNRYSTRTWNTQTGKSNRYNVHQDDGSRSYRNRYQPLFHNNYNHY